MLIDRSCWKDRKKAYVYTPNYLALMLFGAWVFFIIAHVTLLSLVGAATAAAAAVDGAVDGQCFCIFNYSVIRFIFSHLVIIGESDYRLKVIESVFTVHLIVLFNVSLLSCIGAIHLNHIVKFMRACVRAYLCASTLFRHFLFLLCVCVCLSITTYAKMQSIG